MRLLTICFSAMLLLSTLAFGQDKLTEIQKAEYSSKMIDKYNSILNGKPGRGNDLTMFYVDLALNKQNLTKEASAFFKQTETYVTALNKTYVSPKGYYQINYTTTGTDSVDITCTNTHGVPDYIDVTANCLDSLYELYQAMGFTKAYIIPGSKFNVNISRSACRTGVYGFCSPVNMITATDFPPGDNPGTTDLVEKNAYYATLTINSNFRDFEYNPTRITEHNNIRITCAHEFMHGIQFGYDMNMVKSCMESCAVWAETVVYPGISQYMQYSGVISNPEGPMDYNDSEGNESSPYYNRWYSTWVFPRFISERFGNQILPELYRAFVPTVTSATELYKFYTYYLNSYNAALSKYGTNFQNVAKDVFIGLAMMSFGTADDAHAYQSAKALRTYWNKTLGRSITYETTLTLPTTEVDTIINFDSYADGKQTLKRLGCNNIKVTSSVYNYRLVAEGNTNTDTIAFVLVRFDKSLSTMVKVEYPQLIDGKYVFDVRDCSTYKTAVLLCVNQKTKKNLDDSYYKLQITPNYNPVSEEKPVSNSVIANVSYANPSNGTTSFSFDLTKSGSTTLELVDITGYVVSTFANEFMTEGHKSFEISTPAASGMYFVRVRHSEGTFTYPLSIVK